MGRAAWSIVISVAIFAILVAGIYSWVRVSPERQATLESQIVYDLCLPEPAERYAYLVGLVFLPLSMAALHFAACRCTASWPRRAAGALESLLAGFVDRIRRVGLRAEAGYMRRQNLPAMRRLLFAFALLPGQWLQRGGRWRPHLVAFTLIGFIFLASFYTEQSPNACKPHFSAVFSPVVQLHQGKCLMVDANSQYGLYPAFLQPVFSMTGLSVLKFTFVMGLLTSLAYAALWMFLSQAIRSPNVALMGFLALISNQWFYFMQRSKMDLYLQYLPIRFFVPAILVLLAWRYFQKPRTWLYWTTMLFVSAGVLWNLDSGVVALLAWWAVLAFAELFGNDWRRGGFRILRHLAAGGATLALVVGGYMTGEWLRVGVWPDFYGTLVYQRIFYVSGFYMLPMKLLGAWLLVAITYLAGIAYCIEALQRRTATARTQLVFLLTLLGMGLFSYFQGRSHQNVLLLAGWPCFPLLALFLDELWPQVRIAGLRFARPLPLTLSVLMAGFLAGSALCLPIHIGSILRDQCGATHPGPSLAIEDADFLRRSTSPGDEIFMATHGDAVLHLLSGIPSPHPSSLTLMVQLADFHQLCARLRQQPKVKVWVNQPFLPHPASVPHPPHRGLPILHDLLMRNYEIAGRTPRGYLFAKCEQSADCYPEDDPRLHFRVRLRDGSVDGGLSLGPVAWDRCFTLDVLLKPFERQTRQAMILSNLDGRKGMTGIALHWERGTTYSLVAADGNAVRKVLEFPLRPESWNHLAIVARGESVEAYVAGELAARGSMPAAKNSVLPLHIGISPQRDRQFRGLIREVRVFNQGLSPEEISRHANAFLSAPNGKSH